ncbi:hypothetical protein ABT009_37855 [Streptomyces sp. NPDC002896]
MTSKIHLAVDGRGRPLALTLAVLVVFRFGAGVEVAQDVEVVVP